MRIEEVAEELFAYALSGFAEHPAGGFVDEVMLVREESRRDGEYHARVSLHDKVEACQDDYTVGPEVFACDAPFDEIRPFRFRETEGEIWSDNVSGGCIHQIPVIDLSDMLHVKVRKLFDREGFLLGEFYEQEHAGETFLVILALKQCLDRFQRGCTQMLFHRFPRIGDFYTQEAVSFAVLSGTGLEKPRKEPGFFRV